MNKKFKKPIEDLVLAAMFLSIAIVLPLLTSQIKEIGDSLLPMHIPVLLCGLICGAKYGAAVGLTAPILRSLIFSMPPLYPNSIYMALELATYGLVIGLLYRKKSILSLYISLISAQLAGRVVWGISKAVLLGVSGKVFTVNAFLIGGFADAALGILLQLLLIPTTMILINKTADR